MAAENREPSIAFGKDAGEFGDRSSEEFGGRQSDGEPSRVQEGRHRSGRSRWLSCFLFRWLMKKKAEDVVAD